jgi:uncharacterized membrane protein
LIYLGRANVIGHGVGAVLGIAGLVWGSSTIQHQIQLQVATVNLICNTLMTNYLLISFSAITEIKRHIDVPT